MVEVIALGFLLSISMIVMNKSSHNLGFLDPWGVKMLSLAMLAVLLSLINLILVLGGS